MSSETRRAYIKMSTENLWHSYESTAPDSDESVLLHLEDGEVWTGYLDGDTWRYVSGDRIEANVVHWAHFPQPPEAA